MKRQDEKGSGVVEGILIIIVLGIIGFVGWRIYTTTEQTDATNTSTVQSSNNAPATNALPDNLSQFQNKDLHIQFRYPKEWGEAQVTVGAGAAGRGARVTFAGNAAIRIEMQTHDYQQLPAHISQTTGFGLRGASFSNYEEVLQREKQWRAPEVEGDDYFVAVGLQCVDIGYEIRGYRKAVNSEFTGVGIEYYRDLQGHEICNFGKNLPVDGFVEKNIVHQITEVLKTVKAY